MSSIKGHTKGNNFALKFKTPEERKALCDDYCKHMEQGLAKEEFVPCDMQTFRKYLHTYPEDFDTEKIEQAERKGRLFWSNLGIHLAAGDEKMKFAHPSIWIFNMKNRYGWTDKHDLTSGGKAILPEPLLTAKALKAMMKMMMLASKGIEEADILEEATEEIDELPAQTV